MARQPEARLVRKIRAMLIERGAAVFNIHGDEDPYQEAGIPDLLCCYKGHFIGLEVKDEFGKPSRIQLAVLRRIERADGTAQVVRSVQEVERILAKLDRKR
jgi:hypothetical protein